MENRIKDIEKLFEDNYSIYRKSFEDYKTLFSSNTLSEDIKSKMLSVLEGQQKSDNHIDDDSKIENIKKELEETTFENEKGIYPMSEDLHSFILYTPHLKSKAIESEISPGDYDLLYIAPEYEIELLHTKHYTWSAILFEDCMEKRMRLDATDFLLETESLDDMAFNCFMGQIRKGHISTIQEKDNLVRLTEKQEKEFELITGEEYRALFLQKNSLIHNESIIVNEEGLKVSSNLSIIELGQIIKAEEKQEEKEENRITNRMGLR